MNNFLIYITESAVSIALFFMIYAFLLKNKTTHKFCRLFLLVAIVFSITVPLNTVSISNILMPEKSNKVITGISDTKRNYDRFLTMNNAVKHDQKLTTTKNKLTPVHETVHYKNQESHSKNFFLQYLNNLNGFKLILIIYFTGALIFLLRFIHQIFSILVLIKRSRKVKNDNIHYILLKEDISPFSFFNYIFINESKYSDCDKQKIIEHEKIHIKQYHSIDILFFEIFNIVQWFNPFMWFMKNSIRMTHEYLADKDVIKNAHDISNYQSLLLMQLIYPGSYKVANSFSFKPIKKRLTMMSKNQTPGNKKRLILEMIPVVLITLLFALIVTIISCTNTASDNYRIIKFTGDGSFFNTSKASYGYVLAADSNNSTAMMVEDGDLIAIADYHYYYKNKEETDFHITCSDSALYINNELASLVISEKYDVFSLMEQLNNDDLLSLQSICISENIKDDHLPYIKKIAEANPETGLLFEGDKNFEKVKTITSMFKPLWLGIKFNQNKFDILSDLNNTELLFLSLNDSIISKPLPEMPALRHLIFFELEENAQITNDFLINNKQVESVVFWESNIANYDFLSTLTNLKKVSLSGFDIEPDIDFVKQFPNLEVFGIVADTIKNINSLYEVSTLKWLILSGEISQPDFNKIIDNNKELEILEIIACPEIQDLQSLADLKRLEGLTIADTLGDYSTLTSLTNLKYLSLPGDIFDDSVYYASLQNSLPECTIVPNGGFCLGSGWLLLLFPFIALFRIFRRKKTT